MSVVYQYCPFVKLKRFQIEKRELPLLLKFIVERDGYDDVNSNVSNSIFCGWGF